MADMLEKIIDPVPVADFRRAHWEMAPLHVIRPMPDWCSGLPVVHDLDSLVALAALEDWNSLRIVQSQAGLPTEMPLRGKDGPRGIEAVYRAYAQGWSVLVNGLHRRSPEVARLATQLGDALRHEVGVNLYVTPPGAQGFAPHMDGHDVFILQTSGTKQWRVYAPAIELPLEDQNTKIDPENLGPCLLAATLEPGHVLYIPRGFVHEGVAGGESSLHLTIGVHAVRWVEIVSEAVRHAAERMVEFRRSVPTHALSPEPGSAELKQTLRGLLEKLAESGLENEAIRRMGQRVVRTSRSAPDGHFTTIDRARTLSLTSLMEVRPGLTCLVEEEGGRARIEFGRNCVYGPEEIASALRLIAARRRFRVNDLPAELSDSSKIVLVRRLVQEGLLSFTEGK